MKSDRDKQNHLLIVEDEKLVRWYLSQELNKRCYNVDCAASGEEAVEKLKQKRYDVVITDIRLEGIGGLEVAATTKKLMPKTRVIVITAYGSPEVEIRAKECGVFRFLNKPVEGQLIARVIEDALQNQLTQDRPDDIQGVTDL